MKIVKFQGFGSGIGSSPEMTVTDNSGGETIGAILFNRRLIASSSLEVDMNGPIISCSLKPIF